MPKSKIRRRSHRRMKGLINDVLYVFPILAAIFVLLGVLSNVQLITLPELDLPQIIAGGGGGATTAGSTVTVPIIWEVEWGASGVKTNLNPLSIIIGGESFTSIRATAILDYEAQCTIIGSEILDKMQLLFDGVVKKQIPFTLPQNPTPPVTIGILEVTASEIAVWDKGAYATHILAFNIPAGGNFTVNFASGTTTTTNIEASSSNVTLTVTSQGNIEYGLTLKYATDFENIVKVDPHTLSLPILHRFTFTDGYGSVWMEGLDRTGGPVPHSGSRCVGMELTTIDSNSPRCEFNIVSLNSLVGSKLFVSVWLYLPADWGLFAPSGNWYELANPMTSPYDPTYLPYWALHICNPPSFQISIDTRGLDGKLVGMASTPIGSVVRDPPAYPLPRGRWFNLEYYVLRSSARGVADGAVKVWIDGRVVCDLSGVVTSGGGDWGTCPADIYSYTIVQADMPYKLWVDDLSIYGPS
jgi:hypothetical protein